MEFDFSAMEFDRLCCLLKVTPAFVNYAFSGKRSELSILCKRLRKIDTEERLVRAADAVALEVELYPIIDFEAREESIQAIKMQVRAAFSLVLRETQCCFFSMLLWCKRNSFLMDGFLRRTLWRYIWNEAKVYRGIN